jgi:hypothetical protein
MWAAGADIGIDAANMQYQMDDRSGIRPPSLLRTMAPGLTVWGAWGASEKLKKDAFADSFMRRKAFGRNWDTPLARGMASAEGSTARRSIAQAHFARNAEKIQRMNGISNAAAFASKAETSYLRQAASVGLRRFATALNVGFFIAPALYGMTMHGFKGIKKLGYELETPNAGGHFVLNAAQATERQRALSAMHNSEFNGRSALGNEAQLYHM